MVGCKFWSCTLSAGSFDCLTPPLGGFLSLLIHAASVEKPESDLEQPDGASAAKFVAQRLAKIAPILMAPGPSTGANYTKISIMQIFIKARNEKSDLSQHSWCWRMRMGHVKFSFKNELVILGASLVA